MPRIETKDLPIGRAALELKKPEDAAAAVRVAGYGSTFGGEPDSYGDVIVPGAYAQSIKAWAGRSYPLPMLFNHEPKLVIGKWSTLAEDAAGLKIDGELTPGHSLSKDVEASLRHGAISGLSIGYKTRKSSDGAKGVRLLEEIELFELSVVTSPANEAARVTGLKSADEIGGDLRAFEEMLRDACGYSHRHAKHIATHGFRSFLKEVRDEPLEPGHQDPPSGRHDGTLERPGDATGAASDTLLAALRGLSLTQS